MENTASTDQETGFKKKKFSKLVLRAGLALLVVVIVLAVTAIAVFRNEISTLASIKKVDDYGMFQMEYHGDYKFDKFLLAGAANDQEFDEFLIDSLLGWLPGDSAPPIEMPGAGCTAFVTRNENGDVIYGRNFDFPYYSPSMQVITRPENGYASVSTANLMFLGFSEDNLPSGLNFESVWSLAAPYVPFDGVNEKGVAISLLQVPETEVPFDENKLTLPTTVTVRLVLDKAATVDEAIGLLEQYNIYFSSGVHCHFLIADASGRSVVVNYFDGGLKVTDTEVAANFIMYNNVNLGAGFERHDKVKQVIADNNGILSEAQAIDLLAEVGGRGGNGEDILEWSAVYNLNTFEGTIFAKRNTDNRIHFSLSK